MCQGHHSLETWKIALVHSGDLFCEILLLSDFRHGKEPFIAAIPQNNAHLDVRTDHVQHSQRTLPRHFIPVHELHTVHHQRHGTTWKDLFATELHVERKHAFQRRPAITARCKCLIPADTNQPDPEI